MFYQVRVCLKSLEKFLSGRAAALDNEFGNTAPTLHKTSVLHGNGLQTARCILYSNKIKQLLLKKINIKLLYT